jgi:hypothetical protein
MTMSKQAPVEPGRTTSRKTEIALWTLQVLVAALFLFAGPTKLIMPAEELVAQSQFSVAFLRFIGVAETLGALGLLLPGIFRIARGLTSLAAAGLAIIMVGATVITAAAGAAAASVPFVTALCCAIIAHARSPYRAVRRPVLSATA